MLPMNAELQLQISPHQQELILRGLRYVRSSVALDMIDYTPDIEASRRKQYDEIAELEGLLTGKAVRSTATVSSAPRDRPLPCAISTSASRRWGVRSPRAW